MIGDLNSVPGPSPAGGLGSSRGSRIFIAAVVLVAGAELFVGRYHFLDDAFIHLRIAHNLVEAGQFTYNLSTPSFSSSSPGYTLLLSLFSLLTRSAMLPKAVGVLIYLIILGTAAVFFLRPGPKARKYLLGACLVVLVSPLAIRWLTDGMETGLVMLTSSGLALACGRSLDVKSGRTWPGDLLIVLLSAWSVLVRVEFLFILFFAVLIMMARMAVDHWEGNPGPRRQYQVRVLAFLGGAAAGFGVIYLSFGHILPDTAVAKEFPGVPLMTMAWILLKAHLSSSLFGVGLAGLVLASGTAAIWSHRRPSDLVPILIATGAAPAFLAALVLRPQIIQGVRYFVFVYAFIIAFNLARIGEMELTFVQRHARSLVVLIVLAAGCAFPVDAYLFHRINTGRSRSFLAFTSSDLSGLEGTEGIAFDIGMIGYFSRGVILDVNGLVNGRRIASLSIQERIDMFCQSPVSFLFLNQTQQALVETCLPIEDFEQIGGYDFPNAKGDPDTHYLLVRKDLLRSLPRLPSVQP